MKCLVVGNADSIYIKSLIEKTMLAYNEKVSVLSRENKLYSDYYAKKGIKVIREKSSDGKIGTLLCGIKNLKTFKNKYDTICFHYITNRSLMMIPIAKFFGKKVFVSYWGSDILREKKGSFPAKVVLKLVDGITVINSEMLKKFHLLYGRKFDKKIHMIDFGSDTIDCMKKMTASEDQIRNKYNIGNEKVIVSVGYNSSEAQQHLKVLEKIMLLPEEQKKNIHLILRITYGSDSEEYKNKIKELTKKTGCTYSFFESYLSEDEISEITKITDIFIHAQTTDAQSATMCEHLYCKCLVLNPQWIRYKELENKVFYLSFKDFDDMLELLKDNISKKETSGFYDKMNSNSEVIFEICSWETYIPKWRKLYLLDY